MGWLTGAGLFWLGLPLFFAGRVAIATFFARQPDSGKSVSEELAETWQNIGDDQSGSTATRAHLERLLRQGYDHGFVVLSFKGTDAFIQFTKYIHAKGDCGLELGFPDAEWSREYFPRLAEWCAQHGFAYDVEPDSQGGGLDFLHVDTGDELDAAMRLVEGIVTDIFGLEPDARFSYQFDGVSELGEEIDDPAAAPLSPAAATRRQNEHYFEKSGVYMTDGCLYVLVLLLGGMGFIGLEYSLFWRAVWLAAPAQPPWGNWALDAFGVALGARTFEISCLVLLMGGLLLQWSAPARRMAAAQKRNWSDVKRRDRRRRRLRNRYVYLPLMLTALVLFWLRG